MSGPDLDTQMLLVQDRKIREDLESYLEKAQNPSTPYTVAWHYSGRARGLAQYLGLQTAQMHEKRIIEVRRTIAQRAIEAHEPSFMAAYQRQRWQDAYAEAFAILEYARESRLNLGKQFPKLDEAIKDLHTVHPVGPVKAP